MIDIEQIGPYKIHAELGSGGTSIVHQATDTRNGQEIALKILKPYVAHDPSFLRRFVEEGRNAQRLDHPSIVKILDADEADQFHYIAMELISGGTLLEALKKRARLMPLEEALEVLQQIATGLDYAHELEILHRDIKLSNILLTEDGRALISDFGSAKRMTADATLVTQIGFSIGTPTFMSPEQAKGVSRIDQRSDIYSLGVVAYTLLTGKLPFQAENPLALLHKIVYESPPLPQSINPLLAPGLDHALQRVLRKEPDARYETASLFVDALTSGQFKMPIDAFYGQTVQESYTDSQPEQHSQKTKDDRQRSRLSNYLYLILLAAAVSVGLVFIPILFTGQSFRDSIIVPQQSETLPTANPIVESIITNPPLPAAESTTTENLAIDSTKPIVLSPYVDQANQYMIYIPTDWQIVQNSNIVNFTSPDLPVNLFIQSIANDRQANTPAAIIREYLHDKQENYKNMVFLDGYGRLLGTLDAYEQIFSAESQVVGSQNSSPTNTTVQLRLTVITAAETNFIIGSIVDKSIEPSLSTVISTITDSFSLLETAPAALAAPTSTITLLPTLTVESITRKLTPTSGATLGITPTLTSTPTVKRITIDRTPTSAATSVVAARQTTAAPITQSASITLTVQPTATLILTEAIALLLIATPAIKTTSNPVTTTGTALPIVSATAVSQITTAPTERVTTKPTARSSNTPRPTRTLTPGSTIIALADDAINTPTRTRTPTAVRPTPTNKATSTLVNTSTNTPTTAPTVTRPPTHTSTPIPPTPTAEQTTTPTDTPTAIPTDTPTAIPTDTPQPTNTPFPTAVPTINTGNIQPNLPVDNADGNGTQLFQWHSSFIPPEGQGFELIFWKPTQDPIVNGFGLASPTKKLQLNVDLDALDIALADLLEPGAYQWGILLVTESPYTRLRYLGGGNTFTFERSNSSSRQPATGE